MLSIVIPVLNEANTIKKLLSYLLENSSEAITKEIIVVDGGSSDTTAAVVTDFITSKQKSITKTKLQLIHSEKGRAKQMNAGAKKATASVLYFLHADSYPPTNFDALIMNEVSKGNPAGCFRLKFDSNHWWLRLAGWLTQFPWRACRGGDQSQFITTDLFNAIGGFDESFVIYEDNILINELYSRKSFVVIQEKITTSARLYEKVGIWTLQYHFWVIYIKKWLGADAKQLHNYYNKHIKHKRK